METQTTEWKSKWHDNCLHTICAFANANGGVLEIGRNDKGTVVGIPEARKLLESLPNKLVNSMGIVADIKLKRDDDKQYLRINVKPYNYPISCNGKYYLRSGSTTMLLTGSRLDDFLLGKYGQTWDCFPIPNIKVSDFESDAFKVFRKKATQSQRMSEKDLDISNEALLDSLHLTEGNDLTRAAILLFYQDHEKWFRGAFVKIGKFASDTNLVYQHEIHGPLISLPDKVMETLYLNYFRGLISYQGIQRIETYPVPPAALREAITNAIVHRDYSTGIPIQIKVFDDRVIIYNDARLPEKWTIQDLYTTHRSEPHNPLIANAFFRSGMIESRGRGIEMINEVCREDRKPLPVLDFKHDCEFSVMFYLDYTVPEGYTDAPTESISVNDLESISVNDPDSISVNDLENVRINDPVNPKNIRINDPDSIRINDPDSIRINDSDNIRIKPTTNVRVKPTANVRVKPTANVRVKPTAKVKVNPTTKVRIKPITNVRVKPTANVRVNSPENIIINKTKRLSRKTTQQKMLSIMIKSPSITIIELSLKLGITERHVWRNIKYLRDADYIEHIGADKNGHWLVKRKK